MNSFENDFPASGHAAPFPTSQFEAVAGIAAPHTLRIDVGVMPAIRPYRISDSVSLSDKLGQFDRAFVSEERAIDSALAAVADEVSPNKSCVSGGCS